MANKLKLVKSIVKKTPLFFIFPVIGYFIYGKSVSALLGIILLGAFGGFATLAGLIPVIGVWFTHILWNKAFEQIAVGWDSGIYPTMLTNVMYVMNIALSVFFTIIGTIWLSDHLKIDTKKVFSITAVFGLGIVVFTQLFTEMSVVSSMVLAVAGIGMALFILEDWK